MDENLLRVLRSAVREYGFDLVEAHLRWLKERTAEEGVARRFKHRNPTRRREIAHGKAAR
jgi:hypothetical protein